SPLRLDQPPAPPRPDPAAARGGECHHLRALPGAVGDLRLLQPDGESGDAAAHPEEPVDGQLPQPADEPAVAVWFVAAELAQGVRADISAGGDLDHAQRVLVLALPLSGAATASAGAAARAGVPHAADVRGDLLPVPAVGELHPFPRPEPARAAHPD